MLSIVHKYTPRSRLLNFLMFIAGMSTVFTFKTQLMCLFRHPFSCQSWHIWRRLKCFFSPFLHFFLLKTGVWPSVKCNCSVVCVHAEVILVPNSPQIKSNRFRCSWEGGAISLSEPRHPCGVAQEALGWGGHATSSPTLSSLFAGRLLLPQVAVRSTGENSHQTLHFYVRLCPPRQVQSVYSQLQHIHI